MKFSEACAQAGGIMVFSLFTALASTQVLQPEQRWVPLVTLAFFIAIITQKLWNLSSRLRPRVKIIYGTDGYFRHSYQDRVLYRIGVTGLSASHIENVHVYIESIEPPNLPCLPAHLHLMNDNLPIGSRERYKESFNINSGDPPKYVDVVIIPNPEAIDSKTFEVQHIVDHKASLLAGEYRLSVLVTAKSGQPDRSKFIIVSDEDGRYQLTPDDGREINSPKSEQRKSDELLILMPSDSSANIRMNKNTGSYLGAG